MKKLRALFLAALLLLPAAAGADPARSPEVQAFMERGRKFYSSGDYESAIKTWSKVLDMEPLNEEAALAIEDARFQANYRIAVLDKLKKEERLKTPYAEELGKMADEMGKLIERAKDKIPAEDAWEVRQKAVNEAFKELETRP